MITARPQKDLNAAKTYFRQHLIRGDYHSQERTIEGYWFGQGARRLGLDPGQPVDETRYIRLCENRHPGTGERLTVRQRKGDRRIFYDFVASAPKSVSILGVTGGDRRVVAAHEAACRAAMEQMEKTAATRVRKGGKRTERITGEIVAAMFRHEDSRSLDPQLHTHFVVFNATWDAIEGRWKALEPTVMFDQIRFYTEVYRSELAYRLRELGYTLRNTANGFEIDGLAQTLIDRFSKRRRIILAAEAKLTAGQGKTLSNNARAALSRATRARKRNDLSPEEVRNHQLAQLQPGELESIRTLIGRAKGGATTTTPAPAPTTARKQTQVGIHPAPSHECGREQLHQSQRPALTTTGLASPAIEAVPKTAAASIDFARDHLFERQSVVARHELLREALVFARGALRLEDIQAELAQRTEFITVGQSLTTKEALRQEQQLIAAANHGACRAQALNPGFAGAPALKEEQRRALQEVLRSTDQVIALAGRAGTGKTWVLTEIVRGIEQRHKEVVVLAPTTAAVEVLRAKKLTHAATVQRFLADPEFQRAARGRVIMVDEASLLSVQDALALVELAHSQGARLILSGDSRQHSSVEAGDALRLLEERSILRLIKLSGVQRQVDLEYRAAITEAAEGKGPAALHRLERMGAVVQAEDEVRYMSLAADYVRSVEKGKSALIVSPTWREIETVTSEVRTALKAAALLSKEEVQLKTHRGLKWTRAEKRDLRKYKKGMVVTFHKATRDFANGDWARIVEVHSNKLCVQKPNQKTLIEITGKQAACFDVAQEESIPIASGERLLLQGNCRSSGLYNGQLVTVKTSRADGSLVLADNRIVPAGFRAFTHGYCVTSHGAQGRTVDQVFVAIDSHTEQAAHINQFYVSISRARERVTIYTDDIRFLRDIVAKSGARLSAMELLESGRHAIQDIPQKRQTEKLGVKV